MSDSVADQPGTDPSPPPYRYELMDPGCPHCGRGETWKIIGPTAVDTRFMTEDDVQVAVDGLNKLYAELYAQLSKEFSRGD